MYEIRRVVVDDQDAFVEHVQRQSLESGANGQPIFMPFAVPPNFADATALAWQQFAWAKEVGELGWIAEWAATCHAVFVAHISLNGGAIEAQQHRALVQLGVEQAHQSNGLATRLLEEVIGFARGHGLTWLDLRVFAHNDRAIALYKRFGFEETGRVTDCFRVGQVSIDDISMSLRL